MAKKVFNDIQIPIKRILTPNSVITLKDLEFDTARISFDEDMLPDHIKEQYSTNSISVYACDLRMIGIPGISTAHPPVNASFLNVKNRPINSYIHFNIENNLTFSLLRITPNTGAGFTTIPTPISYRVVLAPIGRNDSMSMKINRYRASADTPTYWSAQHENATPFEIGDMGSGVSIGTSANIVATPGGNSQALNRTHHTNWWATKCFIGGNGTSGTGNNDPSIIGSGGISFSLTNAQGDVNEFYIFDLLRNYLGRNNEAPQRYEVTLMAYNPNMASTGANANFLISFRRIG